MMTYNSYLVIWWKRYQHMHSDTLKKRPKIVFGSRRSPDSSLMDTAPNSPLPRRLRCLGSILGALAKVPLFVESK